MIKVLLLSVLLATAGSCGSSETKQSNGSSSQEAPVVTETNTTSSEAMETQETPKKQIKNSMLLGEIEKNDFLSPPFDGWFNTNYDNFSPEPAALEKIGDHISEVDKIVVYMGTWCPDSKREVPHFFRILEEVDYNLEQVEMVAVDRSKTAPDNSQELYQIQRVPTFIFYKDGDEIGRFVERPVESLETDLAKIVSGEEYKHAYE